MIYIEEKRKTDFKTEIAELEGLFPSFQTNGVRIKLSNSVVRFAPVFIPNQTDTAVRNFRITTPPSLTSPKVMFIDPKDGIRKEVIYTKTPPSTDKAGNYIFNNLRRFELKDDMVIDGTVDLEKIIFLYYFSNEFTNGKQKREGARYQFEIPAVKAKAKASDISMKATFANELLVEGTRKDYKWILSMFNALSMMSSGVEEDDRVTLYDYASETNAHKFRERYEHAKKNIEALSARDGSNKIDDLTNLVKDLAKAKILKEKDGWWITLVNNEERTLVLAKGENAGEKRTHLVDWLISQPNEETTLKSYLN